MTEFLHAERHRRKATLVARLLVVVLAVVVATTGSGAARLPVFLTAVLCGAVVMGLRPGTTWPAGLSPVVRRWVAPAVVTAAVGGWGAPLVPLFLVAAYDLGAQRRVRTVVVCTAVAGALNLLGWPATRLSEGGVWSTALLLVAVAVLAGAWRGSRQRLVVALADQVESLREQTRLREDAARSAERTRIAAEMHDVLAHRLSLLALHTGVLLARDEDLPPTVHDRLALLRATSVDALQDLREVLGALHHGSEAASVPTREPAVPDLAALVAQSREAGQDVVLTVDGDPGKAPTAHLLAVHRITREALTNARKHAPGAAVTVHVDLRPTSTELTIRDTGARRDAITVPSLPSGHGLLGVRERVDALGGHLTVGPTLDHGWRVHAVLPRPVDGRAQR